MSDLFSYYETEYLQLSQNVARQIQQIPNLSGEQKKSVVYSAEKNIDEAKQILQHMDLEIRSTPSASTKNQLNSKLKGYESDLTRIQRDFKSARSALAKDGGRGQLFEGASNDDYSSKSTDQRERLLAGNEKLNDSSTKLKRAQQTAVETEDIGAGILNNLYGQRDTLNRTRDNLKAADDNLSRSRRLINVMGRRVSTNKLILAFIILVLLGAIGLVLYFTLRPAPSN